MRKKHKDPTLPATDDFLNKTLIKKLNAITDTIQQTNSIHIRRGLLCAKIGKAEITGVVIRMQFIVNGIISMIKHFVNHEIQCIDELSPIIFIDSFKEVSISIVIFLMTFLTESNMHMTKSDGKRAAAIVKNISSISLGYGQACSLRLFGSFADGLRKVMKARSISFCSPKKHSLQYGGTFGMLSIKRDFFDGFA